MSLFPKKQSSIFHANCLLRETIRMKCQSQFSCKNQKNRITLPSAALVHRAIKVISVQCSPASGDFCRLLITFANSLDQDQTRQMVGSDLDPMCLTFWWYSWKIFLNKLIRKKIHRRQKKQKTKKKKKKKPKKQNKKKKTKKKKHAKLPSMQRQTIMNVFNMKTSLIQGCYLHKL